LIQGEIAIFGSSIPNCVPSSWPYIAHGEIHSSIQHEENQMNQVEKKIMSVALFALAASSLLYASGSSAQTTGGILVRNDANGRCLDSPIMGKVIANTCAGQLYQKWSITQPDSLLVIKNASTGLCLASNGYGLTYTTTCSGRLSQHWFQVKKIDGRRMIVNADNGRCLESNANGDVYTDPCNSGRYQLWY
jgi:Ricin-type beta-trefoil lectin domain